MMVANFPFSLMSLDDFFCGCFLCHSLLGGFLGLKDLTFHHVLIYSFAPKESLRFYLFSNFE
jgi:hypothetical protein